MSRRLFVCALLASACSSSTSSTPATTDAGAARTASYRGTVMDFDTRSPVQATVSAGAGSAQSDGSGAFSVAVSADSVVTPKFVKDGYIKASLQELKLAGDYDDKPFLFASLKRASESRNALTDYDPKKGVMQVRVVPTGGCSDISGSTITVSPSADAKVIYFRNSVFSPEKTVGAGEDPAVLIYNVDANVPLTVTVTSPKCTQAPFPFTDGNATYTGAMSTPPGGETSGTELASTFVRVFMK